MSAAGKSLKECAAFSHCATRRSRAIVGPWPRVLRETCLIGLIRLPVDVAGMMLLDDELPLRSRQVPDALLAGARAIKRDLGTRLAINVGTGIDGIGQNLVDSVVAGLDPADLVRRVHLQRELVILFAKPQPNTARRSCFGEALEHGADGSDDGFVGMEQDLAIGLAPHEAHRQSAPQLAARGLVADAAVEPGAQHVQLGLAHRSLK